MTRRPAEDRHNQQHHQRNCVGDRAHPWHMPRKMIIPVNDGEQESKDHQEVMHRPPALVIEDAPEDMSPTKIAAAPCSLRMGPRRNDCVALASIAAGNSSAATP